MAVGPAAVAPHPPGSGFAQSHESLPAAADPTPQGRGWAGAPQTLPAIGGHGGDPVRRVTGGWRRRGRGRSSRPSSSHLPLAPLCLPPADGFLLPFRRLPGSQCAWHLDVFGELQANMDVLSEPLCSASTLLLFIYPCG